MPLSVADWVSLSSGFGGALIGAIIGGGVSWLLARQTNAATLKRDEAERLALTKSAALQTVLKVHHIVNGVYTIDASMKKSIEQAKENGLEDPQLWQVIKPLVGTTISTPVFDASDFVPFMDKESSSIIDRCMLASLRYNSLETSLQKYSERRLELQDMMADHSVLNQQTGAYETEVPESIRNRFEIRRIELEQLIGQIAAFAEGDLKEAQNLADDISKRLSAKFGKGEFLTLAAKT